MKKRIQNVLVIGPATMPGILRYAMQIRDQISKPETLEQGILGWLTLGVWAAKFAGLGRGELLGAVAAIFDETALAEPGPQAPPKIITSH